MEAASGADPQCAPNVISYSAVMTACCMGGHPLKAEEWFLRMRSRGIAPDHICYSTLIAGLSNGSCHLQVQLLAPQCVALCIRRLMTAALDASKQAAYIGG